MTTIDFLWWYKLWIYILIGNKNPTHWLIGNENPTPWLVGYYEIEEEKRTVIDNERIFYL